VAWWCDEQQRGFELDYLSIILHGIARDAEAFPQPCLFSFQTSKTKKNKKEKNGKNE
jgi:hypothetical protein